MSRPLIWFAGIVLLLLPVVLVILWMREASDRLEQSQIAAVADPTEEVAVAAPANEGYCTPQLKQVLRRVLQSCGLLDARGGGGGGGRGCQPIEARNVATMEGADFNALFIPMKARGGIIQFQQSSARLDDTDNELIDGVFADRRGASYFLVVARASPEGGVGMNRNLSKRRAETVLEHIRSTFRDPELDRQVGLLWLGEEYAQLDPSFCDWQRSGTGDACAPEELNRSAFIAWIDCRL